MYWNNLILDFTTVLYQLSVLSSSRHQYLVPGEHSVPGKGTVQGSVPVTTVSYGHEVTQIPWYLTILMY